MKYKIITFFVAILRYVDCNAQQAIFPASHRMTVYFDNIIVSNIIFGNERMVNIDKIPCVLYDNYYSKYIVSTNDTLPKAIKSKIVKKIFIEKDTILNKNSLHIRTKKAKDGYLFINKILSDEIDKYCTNYDVSYVYNSKIVYTKDKVRQILKLKRKKIKILSVKRDENTKIVTISFSDKK